MVIKLEQMLMYNTYKNILIFSMLQVFILYSNAIVKTRYNNMVNKFNK